MVDNLLKELRKTDEKLMIRVSIADSTYQESSKNNKEVKNSAEEKLDSLEKSHSRAG